MQLKAVLATLALVAAIAGSSGKTFGSEISPASPVRSLQIGYHGLNLAPLFWQVPAERYRVELRPVGIVANRASGEIITVRFDTAHMNASMLHISGVLPGTYQRRMWVETGDQPRLLAESAVQVEDPMKLAFAPSAKTQGTVMASK